MLSSQSNRSTDEDIDNSIMQSNSPSELQFPSVSRTIRSSPSLPFTSNCYNNVRTPFGIHEILGLSNTPATHSNSSSQLPLTMINNFSISSSNSVNRNSTTSTAFENPSTASTYFIPTSENQYYHNFLDPLIQNSNLSTASLSSSQLFPFDSTPFQMHMIDYSTEMNGKIIY